MHADSMLFFVRIFPERGGCRMKLRLLGVMICLIGVGFLIFNWTNMEAVTEIKTDQLNSTYALLVKANSDEVLMSKNSDQIMYPASITKVMTTLVAIEELEDVAELIQLPVEIFSELQAQNAAMAGFEPGEWVSVMDLLYGIMLPSGAECTLAIARHVGGSEENFVNMMNQKADELGLSNTNFTNPIGLHDPNHYSTPKEMVKLLQYSLTNEIFRELFTAPIHYASNGMVLESTMFAFLPRTKVRNGEIIGGRTGFTWEAGRCLISLGDINGREYILFTAGAENSEDNSIRHLLDAIYIYDQL